MPLLGAAAGLVRAVFAVSHLCLSFQVSTIMVLKLFHGFQGEVRCDVIFWLWP